MTHNLYTLVSRFQAEENNFHQTEFWIAMMGSCICLLLLKQKHYIALLKSDQYQISPNNIHFQPGEEVKRIHKMINKGEMV